MRDIDLLVSIGEQHRRQDALRLRRRRGDAGADHASRTSAPSSRRTSREGRCTVPADWRAAQMPVASALMLHDLASIPDDRRAPRADLHRLQRCWCCRRPSWSGWSARSAPTSRTASGPNRVGFEGALQPFADVIKLLFKEELRPKAADALLFTIAPIISATAAFAAFSVIPFGTETTLFGLLRRAAAAAGHRRQRRGAGDLRDHLDGHLRHRHRRLELEQQVLAARRPALVGADDQLRAVVRAGAGGGDHAGRLAVAARDRARRSPAPGGASSRSGTSSCSRSAS